MEKKSTPQQDGPEFSRWLEGIDLSHTVLVYFAKDVEGEGEKFVGRLKSSGIKTLIRTDINFTQITDQKTRDLALSRLGGVFIIPSDQMMREESENVQFLLDANEELLPGDIDKVIFVLSKNSEAANITDLHYDYGSLTALSLNEDSDSDTYSGIRIAESDMFDRFIKVFKQKRLS